MELFSLQLQVAGFNHHATAISDGTGITVQTDSGPRAARTMGEAMREAREYVGPFLHDAERRKLPWGLLVSVSGVSAVYGAWPLLPGRSGSVSEELVAKIRRQYKDGSALAALENALRIIRAYTSDRRAAA
jgi:hypothetical protein